MMAMEVSTNSRTFVGYDVTSPFLYKFHLPDFWNLTCDQFCRFQLLLEELSARSIRLEFLFFLSF